MSTVLTQDVLLASAYITSEEGYIKAEFGSDSTSAKVSEIIRDGEVASLNLADEYGDRVRDCRVWLALEKSSEYIDKIKELIASDHLDESKISIVSSVFSGFDRSVKYANEATMDASSEWVGEVGEQISIELSRYRFVTTCNSKYGESHLFKLYDQAGRLFIWFANSRVDKDLERLPLVHAKVTKHNEREGVKQTMISNVSFSFL